MAWDSATTILNDAAVECGLAEVADPFSSTDPAWVQMIRALKKAGRFLAREHRWIQLTKEATVSMTTATSYTLPTDYLTMVDQTGWNRSTDFPLSGPASPQEWQYLSAITTTPTRVVFRPGDGTLRIYNPSDSQTLAYEYRTAWWASLSSESAPSKEAPTAASDLIYFDPPLAVAATILAWKQMKSLDTTAALADYQHALDLAGGLVPAPVLRLDRSTVSGDRLVDNANYPLSGWAS